MEPGDSLLIEACSGIHTFFMAFTIDAIFLDKHGRVVHLVRRIPPQRMSRYIFSAHSVLELPPGTIEETGTEVGDTLVVED